MKTSTFVALSLGTLLLSCSKEPSSEPGKDASPSSESVAGSTSPSGEEASLSSLAYQEAVRAGFEDMVLKMSFLDENKERQEWAGTLTLVKDRFATVEHAGRLQKTTHLRKWSDIHIANIPEASAEPANRTQVSPLTGKRLVADLMDNGGWKYHLEGVASDHKVSADVERMLAELDGVESGAALFYQDHKLAVGESWQVPIEGMVRWFGNSISEMTGDINVKVERKDTVQDQPCVVLSVALKVQGKMKDPDGQALDVTMEGRGEIWRVEAIEQDLQVEINGTATLSAVVEAQEIKMTVSGPLKITERRKLRL